MSAVWELSTVRHVIFACTLLNFMTELGPPHRQPTVLRTDLSSPPKASALKEYFKKTHDKRRGMPK
jgi:hypothetical protein